MGVLPETEGWGAGTSTPTSGPGAGLSKPSGGRGTSGEGLSETLGEGPKSATLARSRLQPSTDAGLHIILGHISHVEAYSFGSSRQYKCSSGAYLKWGSTWERRLEGRHAHVRPRAV